VLEYDNKLQNFGDSFSKDLALLFGGQTKFRFEARGGWYDDNGKYVEDVPLVIEFCGKKGVIAREAIRKCIVDYLKIEGGEEMVLFQEIPLRGYLE
jgi:hypothetical protein